MDLSIIIVNYNTKKLTLDCVKSIKKANIKIKYEILIVDNASDDPLPKSNDYKLIENKTNLGFAKANNKAIRLAKGKYILLVNSDTIIKKGSIDKLYKFAISQKDAGVVVPRLLNKDGSIQPSCFRLPTITLAIKQYFLNQKGLLDKYAPDGAMPSIVESAVMAAFLITPLARKKVGMLDERFFMYFEDLDYCKRVGEAGLKIYYLPDSEIIHIHGASGGKNKYLIESAKKYHGTVRYYIYTFILWLGQKLKK
jgi:GT2 family glycosyltransferase